LRACISVDDDWCSDALNSYSSSSSSPSTDRNGALDDESGNAEQSGTWDSGCVGLGWAGLRANVLSLSGHSSRLLSKILSPSLVTEYKLGLNSILNF
jgi:hypothetical protein